MDDQHPLTEEIIDDMKDHVRNVFGLHGEEAEYMCMRHAADWQLVLWLLELRSCLNTLRTTKCINEAQHRVLIETFVDQLRPKPQQQEN